jgi:hypothetical protein
MHSNGQLSHDSMSIALDVMMTTKEIVPIQMYVSSVIVMGNE